MIQPPSKTATKKTADAVAEAIIERIQSGEFPEGEPLPPERELSSLLETSRPTIRQALQILQARGYATLEVNCRPRVRKPSVLSILQSANQELAGLLGDTESSAYLDQIRQFIEVGAVRTAAQVASNLQVAQINSAVEACFESLDDDDAFSRADADFHRAIVSVVGNPIILELHDRFVFEIVARRPTVKDGDASRRVSYEEHRLIYEAIAESDPLRAMELMEQHLSRAFRSRLPRPATLG